MNIPRYSRAFLILLYLIVNIPSPAQQNSAPSATWQVYFSPRGGATEAVVQALENAKSSVFVQASSFTSIPIAEALVRAHQRGVRVQVLSDKSQRTHKSSLADLLIRASMPILSTLYQYLTSGRFHTISATTFASELPAFAPSHQWR
jgi:phosphatidylserine/phosphatidylglycerophosphate/cardiolipin synthase-like enzyme